jgi:Fe(3+) dicitrate transport protein
MNAGAFFSGSLPLLRLVVAVSALWLAPGVFPVRAQPVDEASTTTPGPADAPEEAGEHQGAANPGAMSAGDSALPGVLLRDIIVRLRPEDARTIGGSAQTLDEETLEQFRYADPQQLMLQVPGVYVRQEDAFGLRPNIGMRGASSDRSRKVTLMEDGILFGPAPYSAPAAYYFPLVNRMTGMEVYKGPAAILYGPQTIGGAVNFLSRPVPTPGSGVRSGRVEGALGNFLFGRAHAWGGVALDRVAFSVEGLHLGTQGFKELDGGGPTGFDRTELLARTLIDIGRDARMPQQLELRAGYSRERSDETYLGLTESDFRDNPWRRYVASSQDLMTWQRMEFQARHRVDLSRQTALRSAVYRHDMTRTWYRLNGMQTGPPLTEILANPGIPRNRVYLDVLRGEEDSTEAERLLVANNDRSFVSQGAQTELTTRLWTGAMEHRVRGGVRLHYDRIDRRHDQDGWDMEEGRMVRNESASGVPTARNRGETTALAAHVQWATTWDNLTVAPGVRTEIIASTFTDELARREIRDQQQVVLPGVGLHYALPAGWGLLAGVHQGFSPVAPGQSPDVQPERATNSEFGVRYQEQARGQLLEVVGFHSAYGNLVGDCSFSSGCSEAQLDRQFNTGDVRVMGVEVAAAAAPEVSAGVRLPMRVAYTFTDSRFQSAFRSENPQFGDVEEGDALPYVPAHQLFAQAGFTHPRVAAHLGFTLVDRMRETAGSREDAAGEFTDRYAMLDAQVQVQVVEGLHLFARGENLNGARALAARLPFGPRPARPRMGQLGATWVF